MNTPKSRGEAWDQLKEKVDSLVEAFIEEKGLPGMTVAVTRGGRSILAKVCAFIGSLSLAAAAVTVHAQDFHDPESIAWKFRYGLSDAAYHAAWEEYKNDGYLPIDIEMDNGGSDYSGVWQKIPMAAIGSACVD